MPIYPSPQNNPRCHCRENPMRAHFCTSGHMLECHFPFPCAVAGCSHLCKYDLEPGEVRQMEAQAVEALREGAVDVWHERLLSVGLHRGGG